MNELAEISQSNGAPLMMQEDEAVPAKLGQLARDYLVKAANKPKLATEMLCKRLIGDQKLLHQVVEEAIESAAHHAVNHQVQGARRSIWNRSSATARTSVEDLARGIAGALMDYPLPGGPKLSEATREQVNDASKTYLTNAATMSARGRWLAMIAVKLRPGEIVGKKLTEDELADLQEKAKSK